MTHAEKVVWMHDYAKRHEVVLTLEGECGFGRECVGILKNDSYPDYEWYDEETWERTDPNGDVWIPKDAYHKHPCVAVLGRGEDAESQLYDWLKWFDDNGFKVESGKTEGNFHPVELMMGKDKFQRMVKP